MRIILSNRPLWGRAAALAAVVGCWAAQAAWAAQETPVPETKTENDAVQVERTVARDAAIAVASVEDVPVATVGTLAAGNGGFDATLWKGSRPERIDELLAGLPTDTRSLAARSIARRVLLTAAQMPENASPALRQRLLQARMERLLEMERYPLLGDLLAAVPVSGRDAAWYEMRFRLDLLQKHFNEGCALAEEAVKKFPTAYWQEKQLFCQGYRKKYDQVLLTVELMREQNRMPPEWLQNLVLAMAGEEVPDAEEYIGIDSYDEEALAMHAPSGLRVRGPHLAEKVWDYPLMMGTNPALSEEDRLRALEKALLSQRVAVEELHQAYKELTFSEEELKTAAGEGPLDTARKRALHYHLVKKQPDAKSRAAALKPVLAHYRRHGLMPLGALVYAEEMVALSHEIADKEQIQDLAPEAFAVLFNARKFEEARAWLAVAGRKQGGLMADEAVWEVMLRLFSPLDEQDKKAVGIQVRIDGLTPTSNLSSEDAAFWSRAAVVLEGAGYHVPAGYWKSLSPAAPRHYRQASSRANIEALRDAVQGGRKGEALLLALHLIGQTAAELDDNGLDAVMDALNAMELKGEALMLAHEAMSGELLSRAGG